MLFILQKLNEEHNMFIDQIILKDLLRNSEHDYEERYLVLDETEYGVQINSKMKTRIVLSKTLTNQQIEEAVLADEKIKPLLEGKTVEKTIIIPLRLVNIIVK